MQDNKLVECTIPGLHCFLAYNLPDLNYGTPILDIGCGTDAWFKVSLVYIKTTQASASFSRLFLPDKYPGDTLCLLIKHKKT